jgi:uncharacterized membrane protein YgcG
MTYRPKTTATISKRKPPIGARNVRTTTVRPTHVTQRVTPYSDPYYSQASDDTLSDIATGILIAEVVESVLDSTPSYDTPSFDAGGGDFGGGGSSGEW